MHLGREETANRQRERQMSVFSVSSITVKDWDIYQEYMKRASEIIAMYGGKYPVRGEK